MSARAWALVAALVLTGCSNASGAGRHGGPGELEQLREVGLLSSVDGYTLVPATRLLQVGAQDLSFSVQTADGKTVSTYVDAPGKAMQVTLARADATGFTHAVPREPTDGNWTVPLTIAAPGPYRLFADFVATDASGAEHPLVLSAPLTAPGSYQATPVPAVGTSETVGGLTARLSHTGSVWTFLFRSGGRPVGGLQPHLGSFGRLTALHEVDLAYRDAQPIADRPGPPLAFRMVLPQPGSWRVFLEVQRAGTPHLFAFTVVVPDES